MPDQQDGYVHALRFGALNRLYDPLMALTMREAAWRPALVEQVDPKPGETIVDVGCGTGTFLLLLADRGPRARLLGIDGDETVLARARGKAARVGHEIAFQQGMANALPLDDGFADHVVTSLLLHHLEPGDKQAALAEMRRVLAPDGALHVADWGRPRDLLMRTAFLPVRVFDGWARTADHAAGRLPELITEAGFGEVASTGRYRTVFGQLELWRAWL